MLNLPHFLGVHCSQVVISECWEMIDAAPPKVSLLYNVGFPELWHVKGQAVDNCVLKDNWLIISDLRYYIPSENSWELLLQTLGSNHSILNSKMYQTHDSSIQKNGYQGNVCEATENTVTVLSGIITSEQLLLRRLFMFTLSCLLK